MKQRTFRVTFDLVFNDDDGDSIEEIKALTDERIKAKIDEAFEEGSYAFFGEGLSMIGMLTPKVGIVEEVK